MCGLFGFIIVGEIGFLLGFLTAAIFANSGQDE